MDQLTVQKAAIDKMMHDMAIDLAPYGVAAISLWPGMVCTERVLARWQGKPGAEQQLSAYETHGLADWCLTGYCATRR